MGRSPALCCFLLGFSIVFARGQGDPFRRILPVFQIPDTVCVNQWITINPGAISGSNYHWTFCSANAAIPPSGTSPGNPSGVLNDPRYITLAADGTGYFAFLTNTADSSISRIFFGSSFGNLPVSSVNLGSVGLLTSRLRGIQVLFDNPDWSGFVVDGSTLYRFSFSGNTLSGIPTIMNDIPFPSVGASSGLVIRKAGTGWVGFATDHLNNNLIRLVFPLRLNNSPTVENLGNLGNLNGPEGLCPITWNGQCYLFLCNQNDHSVSRVDFGSSFLNSPVNGVNLGNIGGLLDHNSGIAVLGDCEAVNGYIVNHAATANSLVHLAFPGGPAGAPVATSLGDPGSMDTPFGISELLRKGDTLYAFITNTGNNTLTRLTFPACSAASRPGDTARNPAPFYYLIPGTFNIHLAWGDQFGQPAEMCKSIVVMPELTVSLGPDQIICMGDQVTLDPGTGYTTYLWNTGDTTQVLDVDQTGTYWVEVTNRWDCTAADTVTVTVADTLSVSIDTILCFGQRYWAQGAWQTTAGIYFDTLQTFAGCDSIIRTDLSFRPEIQVNLGPDTVICPGQQILLDAYVAGATYLWQDGSDSSQYLVTGPGLYRVEVTLDSCTVADSVDVGDCPPRIWFPTAFTPNGDGLNDTYQPRGISIVHFRMIIFDRWGQQLFETGSMDQGWDGTSKGKQCPEGTYSFIAWYETVERSGKADKVVGSFALVR
jgi:gliding motility-associated-like protein